MYLDVQRAEDQTPTQGAIVSMLRLSNALPRWGWF